MQKLAGFILWTSLLGVGVTSCRSWYEEECPYTCRSWSEILASDTLRAVTLECSATAYCDQGQWKGLEYEKAINLARAMGLKLQVISAPGEQAMLDSLRVGAADVAITPLAYIVAEADSMVQPCGTRYEVQQSLVSVRRLKYTEADSAKYTLAVLHRSRQSFVPLRAFAIDTLPADTFNIDRLVDEVQQGRWDACLLESPLAQMFHNYYPTIRVSDPLSGSADTVAWLVSIAADTLARCIDGLMPAVDNPPHFSLAQKRGYERSRGRRLHKRALLSGGKLSVYDDYFRAAAKSLGWDWRLLASVGYIESNFEPSASHKRARGVMQLEVRTANRFGYTEEQLDDPECNIQAAAQLIAYLERCLRKRILQTRFSECELGDAPTEEQLALVNKDLHKFTLAAYNAGMGHVYDAIALADTLGYDPAVWDYNVGHCLQLKADPEIYKMSCVTLGKFNGKFTCNYVRRVLETYDEFKEQVK